MLPRMSDEFGPEPAVPFTPPSPGRWRVPVVAGLVGLLVGAGGVGLAWGLSGSGEAAKPGSFTLTGTLTLTGDNVPAGSTSEGCTGYSGYDDIAEGAAVTVYDGAGQVVAQGALGAGKPVEAACVFRVSVPDVPEGAKFYQVEVSHRGKLTVSAAEAKAGAFASTLG